MAVVLPFVYPRIIAVIFVGNDIGFVKPGEVAFLRRLG
jgi:hypothetical protein